MRYHVRWAALCIGVGLLELGVLTATSQAAPPFRRALPAAGPAVTPARWPAAGARDRVRRPNENYWRGAAFYKPYSVYPNWWKKRHYAPWPLPVWPYPAYYPPYYPVGPVRPVYPPDYPVEPIYPADYSPYYLVDPGRAVTPPDSPAKPVTPLYPGPLAREIGYRW